MTSSKIGWRLAGGGGAAATASEYGSAADRGQHAHHVQL